MNLMWYNLKQIYEFISACCHATTIVNAHLSGGEKSPTIDAVCTGFVAPVEASSQQAPSDPTLCEPISVSKIVCSRTKSSVCKNVTVSLPRVCLVTVQTAVMVSISQNGHSYHISVCCYGWHGCIRTRLSTGKFYRCVSHSPQNLLDVSTVLCCATFCCAKKFQTGRQKGQRHAG
jgi:hypothetical protein